MDSRRVLEAVSVAVLAGLLAGLPAPGCDSSPTPHPGVGGGGSVSFGDGGGGGRQDDEATNAPDAGSVGLDAGADVVTQEPEPAGDAGGGPDDVAGDGAATDGGAADAAEPDDAEEGDAGPDGGPDAVDLPDGIHEPPPTATIYDLQQGKVALGTTVAVLGVIVTGVAKGDDGTGFGLFVEEPAGGPWSGIWVYTKEGAESLTRGDVVHLSGPVYEFDQGGAWPASVTEIDLWPSGAPAAVGKVIETGGTAAEPAPVVLGAGAFGDPEALEPFEGVLVRVESVTVDDPDLGFGEWSLEGGLRVDDKLFAFGPVHAGDTFASVTGVLDQTFGEYKLVPRDAADLAGYESPVTALEPGDLVLSEVMIDPGAECADASDEYLEIANPTADAKDAGGVVLRWGDKTSKVPVGLVVPAGGRLLAVTKSPSPCYGHMGDFTFTLSLTNTGKPFSLERADGAVLDAVDFTGWKSVKSGVALGLDPTKLDATSNDLEASWCAQATPLATDFGTPGNPNDPCP